MQEMRLHKFIAHCGLASRRKAEELILDGKVEVNGEFVTELGVRINPATDNIKVDGTLLKPERKIYIALHKPRGYVTTVDDDLGRKTVLDLIEGIQERIYPVGRLDRESEGLLILTNDGELANYLTHPRCRVPKIYRVTVDGYVKDETLKAIKDGIRIGGRLVTPKRIKMLHRSIKSSRIEIEIGEGLNREVRRVFAAVDHEARKLIRIEVGPILLEGLPRGMARRLTTRELSQLRTGMMEGDFEVSGDFGNLDEEEYEHPTKRRRDTEKNAPRQQRPRTSKHGRGGAGRMPGTGAGRRREAPSYDEHERQSKPTPNPRGSGGPKTKTGTDPRRKPGSNKKSTGPKGQKLRQNRKSK